MSCCFDLWSTSFWFTIYLYWSSYSGLVIFLFFFCKFDSFIASPLTPYRGQNPQNQEKRVSGSKNSHFRSPQKRAFWAQKSPFLYRVPQGKWGFLDSKRPFLWRPEMGVFWHRNPLSWFCGILTPVGGQRVRNLWMIRKNSRRLELPISKKHPARKVGTRSRQCRPKVPCRFAFPGKKSRNLRICSTWRFGKISRRKLEGVSQRGWESIFLLRRFSLVLRRFSEGKKVSKKGPETF